jgi:hypothetical protein
VDVQAESKRFNRTYIQPIPILYRYYHTCLSMERKALCAWEFMLRMIAGAVFFVFLILHVAALRPWHIPDPRSLPPDYDRPADRAFSSTRSSARAVVASAVTTVRGARDSAGRIKNNYLVFF